MDDMLIWLSAGRLVASLADNKTSISFNGLDASVKTSLGDYDFIVSSGQLVGFVFAVTERGIAEITPLIAGAVNTEFSAAKNELRIILANKIDGPTDIKCIQASSVIYWAKGKPVGIGLSKWSDWGHLAFPILPLSPSETPASR